jgi:hypothetical protein
MRVTFPPGPTLIRERDPLEYKTLVRRITILSSMCGVVQRDPALTILVFIRLWPGSRSQTADVQRDLFCLTAQRIGCRVVATRE